MTKRQIADELLADLEPASNLGLCYAAAGNPFGELHGANIAARRKFVKNVVDRVNSIAYIAPMQTTPEESGDGKGSKASGAPAK